MSQPNTSTANIVLIILATTHLISGCKPSQPSINDIQGFPKPCIPLVNTGLPVHASIQNSHILYQVEDSKTFENELHYFTVADGSYHVLKNIKGSLQGFGFLQDGNQFVIPISGENAQIGSLEDKVPEIVSVDDELLSNFRPYSVFWGTLQEGGKSKYADTSGFRAGRNHSPDGKYVASWKLGDTALTMINIESGGVVKVSVTNSVTPGVWTFDSQQYIFADLYYLNGETYSQVYTIKFDGSELRPLLNNPLKYFISEIDISPDGKKVLLATSGGGAPQDYSDNDPFAVLNLSTNELKVFYIGIPAQSGLLPFHAGIWSPDSQWVAFLAHWGQIDIRALNIESGEVYCITNDALIENSLDWQ